MFWGVCVHCLAYAHSQAKLWDWQECRVMSAGRDTTILAMQLLIVSQVWFVCISLFVLCLYRKSRKETQNLRPRHFNRNHDTFNFQSSSPVLPHSTYYSSKMLQMHRGIIFGFQDLAWLCVISFIGGNTFNVVQTLSWTIFCADWRNNGAATFAFQKAVETHGDQ